MSENTSTQLLPTPPQFGRPTRPQRFLSPTPPKAPPSPVRSDAKRPTRRSFSFGRRKSAPAVPAQLADAYRANAKAVARGDWVCAQALAAQAPPAKSYSSKMPPAPSVYDTNYYASPATAPAPAAAKPDMASPSVRATAALLRFERAAEKAAASSSSAAGASGGSSLGIRRATSFERKSAGRRSCDDSTARRLGRTLSWGRKPSRSRGSPVIDDPAALFSPPAAIAPAPTGPIEMEGYLWKRQATQFKKRWFFLQSGILCYQDPAISDHAIVCGQVTSAVVRNRSRYELTLYTDQRAYEFRVEAEAELEAWIGACTRAAAKWMEG